MSTNAIVVDTNAAVKTLEVIAVTLTDAQQRGVRLLARDSKKSANELAGDLVAQIIRGRVKAKAEGAKEEAGKRYDMLLASGLFDKATLAMLPPRSEYISKEAEKFKDLLSDLS